MQSTYVLSEAERQILLDLLYKERRELHSEIHHTDNRSMRSQLKERMQVIEHLLERVQAVAVVGPSAG